jgi:MAX-binding protein
MSFRRAHLKDCFDSLKAEVPRQRDRKITNLQVLNLAIKYIQVTFFLHHLLKK